LVGAGEVVVGGGDADLYIDAAMASVDIASDDPIRISTPVGG
jgi:hypothetical protein